MQNYIVRVCRAHSSDLESVSGVIEDTESGEKESFHSLIELQTLLANFIGRGQLELTDLAVPERLTHENIAVIA
jgi:hypothetical protein